MRHRLLFIPAFAMLCVIGETRWTAAAPSFDVINDNMSAFTINGVDNPTLTLTRGQTYTFDVRAVGHPFWITTARGAGDTETNAFPDGVTGNGASPGTITFVVPAAAPATLFYQCAFHDVMGGTINVVSAAPLPPTGILALAGLLAVAAAATLRQRRVKAAD
jgi:MYXO-CTERM domain-containing protein